MRMIIGRMKATPTMRRMLVMIVRIVLHTGRDDFGGVRCRHNWGGDEYVDNNDDD